MNEQDRELAPMVDGLSSGLCMLILIATVFMIGAININVASTQGDIQFKTSTLDLKNSVVYLYDGLNLSATDYFSISQQINSQPGNTVNIYGYFNGTGDAEQKLTYNFVVFRQGIKTNKSINFIKGNAAMCHGENACIHWETH